VDLTIAPWSEQSHIPFLSGLGEFLAGCHGQDNHTKGEKGQVYGHIQDGLVTSCFNQSKNAKMSHLLW